MAAATSTSGNTHRFVLSLVRFIGSAIIYAIYIVMYGILTVFNGILVHLLSKRHQRNTRIQFGRILWRRKFHVFEYTCARDFLCIYTSSVEPEYVLKPNVSLYAVTKHEAIFVETPDGINIHSSDENTFFHMAQFTRSKNVIKMSISLFHALAKRLGNPSVPVIWISHTARCGSTLMCQVFEKVPGTLLLSEPDAPTNIDFMQKLKVVSESERDELMISIIRFLCKSSPGTARICIKTRGVCAVLMKDISKLFPQIKQIFLYRNCRDTVASYLAFLSSMSYSDLGRYLYDDDRLAVAKPFFKNQSEIYFLCKLKELEDTNVCSNTVEMFAYMWANYILVARDAMSCDPSILPIKYEDLMLDKWKICKMIFEKLGLDMGHLNTALSAFDRDSQRGSIVSRHHIGSTPRKRIPEVDRRKADAILFHYNLPSMGDDFRI